MHVDLILLVLVLILKTSGLDLILKDAGLGLMPFVLRLECLIHKSMKSSYYSSFLLLAWSFIKEKKNKLLKPYEIRGNEILEVQMFF